MAVWKIKSNVVNRILEWLFTKFSLPVDEINTSVLSSKYILDDELLLWWLLKMVDDVVSAFQHTDCFKLSDWMSWWNRIKNQDIRLNGLMEMPICIMPGW